MFELSKQVVSLLSKKERTSASLLLLMIIVMAALDVFGVASILPFMSVLTNPNMITDNEFLSYFYVLGKFTDSDNFLRFLGMLVFLLIVLSIAFKAITTYALLRFSHTRNFTLSVRLLEGYLRQPYEWFLSRHTSDLGKNVLNEVQQTVNGVLIPLMLVIAHGSLVLTMLAFLIVVDPLITIFIILILGFIYSSVYIVLHGYISRIGVARIQANKDRFKTIQEGFSGIKEVKTGNLEQTVINSFSVSAKKFSSLVSSSQLVGQIPRFILEAFSFGGILVIVIYLLGMPDGLVNGLPILSTFAFAGYKIMPSLQQVFMNATQIRFSRPLLKELYTDLKKYNGSDESYQVIIKTKTKPLGLSSSICLENVCYKYSDMDRNVLKNINLEIAACTCVGIVGTTGAGKTTLVDIILGILKPKSGSLIIDGETICSTNELSWQRSIGYVPQNIYLTDDSIEANIAFGIQKDDIDREAVKHSAQIANIDNFITDELDEKYSTLIGERGVRLSGGQRQRIGIARALYHDPDVLILDEATSALDNVTEQLIMSDIGKIAKNKTIIIIAHRISTVKNCDEIIFMDNGSVYSRGTYLDLLKSCKKFTKFVEIK